MTKNYDAFGRFTAFKLQAKAAYNTRYCTLANLGNDLTRGADSTEPFDYKSAHEALERAELAEREYTSCIEQANTNAALCQEPDVTLKSLERNPGN